MSFSDVEDAYGRHMEHIYAFFAAKLLDRKVAEDLTSETFLTFVKQIKQNENIENIRAYLYGIARNVFMQHLRRKYAMPSVRYIEIDDFATYVETQSADVRSKSLEERITPLIKLLPEKQRIVIHLRLHDKLTLPEIASKLGRDMNYVKTTQKRAIKKLRELVACTPV